MKHDTEQSATQSKVSYSITTSKYYKPQRYRDRQIDNSKVIDTDTHTHTHTYTSTHTDNNKLSTTHTETTEKRYTIMRTY